MEEDAKVVTELEKGIATLQSNSNNTIKEITTK